MKKFIFIFFSLLVVSYSSFPQSQEEYIKAKIILKVIKNIKNFNKPSLCFTKKSKIEATKKSKIEAIFIRKNFKVKEKCNNVDIIIVNKLEEKKEFSKPAFAIDYISFKNCKNCIGGFFWLKGRPQILLIKENLQKFNLKITKELEVFIISKRYVMK